MATVSTRKPATRKPQTLAQQLTCVQERARTAKILILCIGSGDHGFRAEVTSERDRRTTYTITRDPETHDLVCTCPASVVCKHIGRVLMEGTAYHSDARPACTLPPTPPTPERTDSAEAFCLTPAEEALLAAVDGWYTAYVAPKSEREAPAPCSDLLSSVLATMPSQQRCTRCGESWHIKTLAQHYICPTCEQNDREQVEDYWRGFPLLIDVDAEVAAVEAQMEAEGFCWSDEACTWVRMPALAEVAR